MKLAVVVNPLARQMRRDPLLPARLAAITEHVFVTAPDELDALANKLVDAELVAICGGDGTAHALLTATARISTKLPRIALLPGGTINTVARNLGITGSPEELLARLVTHSSHPTIRQALVRVDDGTGPKLGFLFAALLGARFLARYYDHPSPSPSRAVKLALEVAASALRSEPSDVFAPARLDVTTDHTPHHLAAARLLVAATLPDVGVGMRIVPRAQDLPDHFHLVATGISPASMARQIPAVRAGRRLEGDEVVDALCRRATVEFQTTEPYTLDGELYNARTITIEAAGPIEIVRP